MLKGLTAHGITAGLIAVAALMALPADAQRRMAATPELAAGEKAYKGECGACHMPFPPQMLPARSWQALMGDLGKHFKENASLDTETRKAITEYLVAYAGDSARGGNGRSLRGLAANDVPLRITETPSWQREHRRLTPEYLASRNVKSKANCVACHPGAINGDFDD